MSMLYCSAGCGNLIDTDEDCEAWQGEERGEDGRLHDVWLCFVCRAERDEDIVGDLPK